MDATYLLLILALYASTHALLWSIARLKGDSA